MLVVLKKNDRINQAVFSVSSFDWHTCVFFSFLTNGRFMTISSAICSCLLLLCFFHVLIIFVRDVGFSVVFPIIILASICGYVMKYSLIPE